jgi:ABC-type amino acid transport substrate-binding protein
MRRTPCARRAIVAALFATPALSAELTGTLKKIKDSGTITLGHRDASIPFSYLADNPNQPVGYSHDLQLKVVEAVKQELGMPDLKVVQPGHLADPHPAGAERHRRHRVRLHHQQRERQKQVDFSSASSKSAPAC